MAMQKIGNTALVRGMYTCTNLGETKSMRKGEKFPVCSCDSSGEWELLKSNNIVKEDAIILFVGKGTIYAICTDKLPEIGALLNLRSSMSLGHETGKYRISEIDEQFVFENKENIWINVERVGKLSKDIPIHHVRMMSS